MDTTKNVIKDQKKHQIPEKSEEQLKHEAFMKESPSRIEMVNYVQDMYANITNSFNMVFGVLQSVLIAKGLVTAEELEKAGEETIKKLENIKNEDVENKEEL